ncbi:MAG: AP endonuclease, partial [Bacteroidetes bacterium HGW-Bacteroidetes-22]
MYNIREHIHVHAPFYLLKASHLPFFIRERIQPEISFGATELDSFGKEDFRRVGEAFLEAGIPVTLHAPFMDLRPGAVDPRIREASLDRLRQLFDLAPLFRPRSIVCHPSFDSRYYVSSERQWLENSVAAWKGFLPAAEELDLMIALENV